MSQTLDSIGLIHNQVLSVAYASISANRIPVLPSAGVGLVDSVHVVVNEYFSTVHGLNTSALVNALDTGTIARGSLVDFADTCTALSTDAKHILRVLDTAIVRYDDGYISLSTFLLKCDTLKLQCLALPGDQPLFAGSAVTTAKASAQWWYDNMADWDSKIDPPQAGMQRSDKAILRADAIGAASGAVGGIFGGPIGIVTGAYVGATLGSIFEGIAIGFGWW